VGGRTFGSTVYDVKPAIIIPKRESMSTSNGTASDFWMLWPLGEEQVSSP
jgi:hypothetical protein